MINKTSNRLSETSASSSGRGGRDAQKPSGVINSGVIKKNPKKPGWSWFEKAFLIIMLLAIGIIVGGGFWLRDQLGHPHLKTQRVQPKVHKIKKATALKPVSPPVFVTRPLPASVLYVRAQESFDNKDYPKTHEILDEIIKAWPNSQEATAATQSIDLVEYSMREKASSGLDVSEFNPNWNYKVQDSDFFASIPNIPLAENPTLNQDKSQEDDSNPSDSRNLDSNITGIDDAESKAPRYALGLIHSKVGVNSLYGVGLYGEYDSQMQECGHPTLCQVELTLDNHSSMMVNVGYQAGESNGALKISDPTQATDVLNAISSAHQLIVRFPTLNTPSVIFKLPSLDWNRIQVSRSELGSLVQSDELLKPDPTVYIDPSAPEGDENPLQKQGEMQDQGIPLPSNQIEIQQSPNTSVNNFPPDSQ